MGMGGGGGSSFPPFQYPSVSTSGQQNVALTGAPGGAGQTSGGIPPWLLAWAQNMMQQPSNPLQQQVQPLGGFPGLKQQVAGGSSGTPVGQTVFSNPYMMAPPPASPSTAFTPYTGHANAPGPVAGGFFTNGDGNLYTQQNGSYVPSQYKPVSG